jgi:hypothetical protein
MYVDLQEYKRYNDNTEFLNGMIHNYMDEPEDVESISYKTLDGLGFIKDGYFDLDVVERYDELVLNSVLEKVLNDFIWLVDSNYDDFSFDDIENQTEEEYLASLEDNNSSNSILDESSVYYKTLKNNNLISKKKDKYSLNLENLQSLSVDSINYLVSESVVMLTSEGSEYNETVTNALKKLKIVK